MTLAKPCAKPGCHTLTPPGHRHCPQHAAAEQARRAQRVTAYGYSSANWQAVRAARHAAAGGLCELQLPGCTIVATHTHLDPRFDGDHRRATINYVQACCAQCSGAIDAPRATAS